MKAYKQLVAHVLENGTRYETNKGACIGVIGAQVTYDISQGLPIVTGKKTNILWAIAEYAMFLKGINHVDFLRQYNGAEKIWEGQGLSQDLIIKDRNRNPVAVIEDYAKATGIDLKEAEAFFKERTEKYIADRQLLDTNPPMKDDPLGTQIPLAEGGAEETTPAQVIDEEAYKAKLAELETFLTSPFVEAGVCLLEDVVVKTKGDLGPIYGAQWRNWTTVGPNNRPIRIDQLRDVVFKLKENPESRQIIMHSWNPAAIVAEKFSYDDKINAGFMGQPPCHVNYHFLTRKNEQGEYVLNVVVWVRSNDLMLGHPFNAIGGALITHLVAKSCGFKVGTLTMQISDAHIYENHVENAKKYLEAEIFEQPSFELPDGIDAFNFEVEDIMNALGQYKHGPYIPFPLNINDNAMKEAVGEVNESNSKQG